MLMELVSKVLRQQQKINEITPVAQISLGRNNQPKNNSTEWAEVSVRIKAATTIPKWHTKVCGPSLREAVTNLIPVSWLLSKT